MRRSLLLGLAATLNIACAELDRAGPDYEAAASHVNKAVAELHRTAKWLPNELHRMAEVQNELVEKLLDF
jgi:predicted ATP-grasp superfamily ATP-dependent carboligase